MNISSQYLTGSLFAGVNPNGKATQESSGEAFADSMSQLLAAHGNGRLTPQCMSGEEKDALLQQLKDPSGDFFRDMRLATWRAAREKQEDEEEQDSFDLLMRIVDNLSGKTQTDQQLESDWAGIRLGQMEDDDPHTPMSIQMLSYLAAIGDTGTFRIGEDEDQEAETREAIQKNIDSQAAAVLKRDEGDELYAGSTQRHVLSKEEIAELAGKYDPHNMSREEYDAFLDDLVEAGALSRDEIKHLGYQGAQMPLGANVFGGTVAYCTASVEVSSDKYEPSYGWICAQFPMDSDILSWLAERMLWRVSIIGGDVAARQQYAEQDKQALNTLSSILRRMENVQAENTVRL